VTAPALQAGDVGFLGVNNRLDPSQLDAGVCSEAVNMRFTRGVATARKGIRKLNWMNRVVGRTIQPYGTVYGTGKFSDPNGAAWEVVAADGKVYLCREGSPPVQVPLPAGVSITTPVTFTQAFNVLLMFRGEHFPELTLVVPAGALYGAEGERSQGLIIGRSYRWDKGENDQLLASRLFKSNDPAPGNHNVAVTAGKTYRFKVPANQASASLTNGTSTYLGVDGPRVFVAAGDTVVLNDLAGGSQAEVQEVILQQSGDFVSPVEELVMVGAANTEVGPLSEFFPAVLVMERIAEGFKATSHQPNTISGAGSENPSDGTAPIPNADRGLFLQNRVYIPFNRDLIGASDYLNYTRFSPIRAAFRVNQGSSDALVALGRFNETTLIAFKEQSIYAVGNLTGDLSGATLYEITSEYGLSAPKSIAAVGKDLWFLADKRGVCSITLTEQNKIQGVDVPVSQAIEKTIKRINWRYASKATAAYWDNRFYLAVPLDAAEVVKRNVIDSAAVYREGGSYQKRLVTGRKYRWTKGTADFGVAVVTDTVGHVLATDYGPGSVVVPVTAGKTYRWWPYTIDTKELVNGTQTLPSAGGRRNFVAQGNTVTLNPWVAGFGQVADFILEVKTATTDIELAVFNSANGVPIGPSQVELLGTAGQAVTATLQPLFAGVNNAVLVYDFLTQKWSGYDQSQVLQVKDWSLAIVGGRQRLVFFSEDGFLNLYEEGTYDENILPEEPYSLEARLVQAPAPGWQFTIIGEDEDGTAVTATAAASNAPDGAWGIGDPASNATAVANWMAPIEGGWFGAAAPWTHPDHTVRRMSASVVRFHYVTQLEPNIDAGVPEPAAISFSISGADAGMVLEPVAEIFFEPVISRIVTRGYLFDTLEPKSLLRALLTLATLAPQYTVELLTDGIQESYTAVAGRTKNPLKYYRPHDAADFAADNHNGDYLTPYREDYAWRLGPADRIYLDSKIDPELMQQVEEKFWLKGRGKYGCLALTNSSGRFALTSVNLEAVLASERLGTHA